MEYTLDADVLPESSGQSSSARLRWRDESGAEQISAADHYQSSDSAPKEATCPELATRNELIAASPDRQRAFSPEPSPLSERVDKAPSGGRRRASRLRSRR